MIMNKRTYILLLFFLIGTNFVQAQEVQPTWESINERGYPEWFSDAKLGIFIHWGLYSVPAYSAPDGYSEWFYRGLMTGDSIRVGEMKDFNRRWGYMLGDQWSGRLSNGDGMKQNPKPTDLYTLYAMTWAAEHWNPEQWADLFVQSGAKYVVLVTKHHDGYCLWRSRYQPNWNSVVTGPHRDIVGDLTKAVRDAGLKMGFYYSLTEWTNNLHIWMKDPDEAIGDYVDDYMMPQFKELVKRYKPSLIFADGEWQNTAEQFRATELISWYYNTVGPEAVVNDRWGAGTQHGFKTPEYKGAIDDTTRPWAECRGIGKSFALNRNEPLSNYLTSDSLIRHFVKLVAAGGGMTLNVGPDADGTIPMLQQERLIDLGNWLKVNGEAIYGSRPYKKMCEKDSTVYYTRNNGNLYAIATHLDDKTVVLKGMPRPSLFTQVKLLGCDKNISYHYIGSSLIIRLNNLSYEDLCKNHGAWVFRISKYGDGSLRAEKPEKPAKATKSAKAEVTKAAKADAEPAKAAKTAKAEAAPKSEAATKSEAQTKAGASSKSGASSKAGEGTKSSDTKSVEDKSAKSKSATSSTYGTISKPSKATKADKADKASRTQKIEAPVEPEAEPITDAIIDPQDMPDPDEVEEPKTLKSVISGWLKKRMPEEPAGEPHPEPAPADEY